MKTIRISTNLKIFNIITDDQGFYETVSLLEASDHVMEFKVCLTTGPVAQEAFGYGDFSKWVLKFKHEGDENCN